MHHKAHGNGSRHLLLLSELRRPSELRPRSAGGGRHLSKFAAASWSSRAGRQSCRGEATKAARRSLPLLSAMSQRPPSDGAWRGNRSPAGRRFVSFFAEPSVFRFIWKRWDKPSRLWPPERLSRIAGHPPSPVVRDCRREGSIAILASYCGTASCSLPSSAGSRPWDGSSRHRRTA